MKTKTLNKAIIYDDNCPMCKAYTNAFVTTGFLSKENRIPFSEIHDNKLPNVNENLKIDWQRARHEIPVIDTKNGEVFYGIDALAELLQQKLFFVKPILNFKPIRWIFLQLYKLISYNRKIIVANHAPVMGEINSSPDFSVKWRLLFVLITITLSKLFFTIPGFVLEKEIVWLTVGTIIFLKLLILFFLGSETLRKNAIEIIAQVAIVCLMGCFLVKTSIFLKNIFSLHPIFFVGLLLVIFLMLVLQIKSRVQFLKMELK